MGGGDFGGLVDRYFRAGDSRPIQKIDDSEAFYLFASVSKKKQQFSDLSLLQTYILLLYDVEVKGG